MHLLLVFLLLHELLLISDVVVEVEDDGTQVVVVGLAIVILCREDI
jgi:hypothetical protein